MDALLVPTPLLNFNHPSIQLLLREKKWHQLEMKERIKAIYLFVRDEIAFGYNTSDDIPASEVWTDGYGQCNTKATLFMALLRANGIPCRLHGFTIHKALQKGALTGLWYLLSPRNIVHSWVEVAFEGKWYHMEGLILDAPYLEKLQKMHPECTTTFCGFGVYTDSFQSPPVDWNMNHTYIQHKGINQDFGLFNDPDSFYLKHRQALGRIKSFIFTYWVRHRMNAHVIRIRRREV
jgi:hypothetical protein